MDRNGNIRDHFLDSNEAGTWEHDARKQTQRFAAALQAALSQPSTVAAPEPSIPHVPELDEIEMSDGERDAEFDALIARLEQMRVDNEPSKGHRIARAVAKAYGLTFREMLVKRRHLHLVKARQHAMWAMHKHSKLSLPAIGKILGGLDHTTVLYGIRRHQARINAGEIRAD